MRLVFKFPVSVLDFCVVVFLFLRCQYLMKGCATSKNGAGLLLMTTSIASTSQRWELGRWSWCWLMIRVMQSLTFKTLVSSLDIHKGWRKDWWSKWSWWWWKAHWLLQPYQDWKFFLHVHKKWQWRWKSKVDPISGRPELLQTFVVRYKQSWY